MINRREFIKILGAASLIPSVAIAGSGISGERLYIGERDVFSAYEKKFCLECQKAGLKSKVYLDMCSATLVHCGNGYWDEEGNFHPPEPCNTTTCSYHCSNGHSWEEKY